MKKYAQTPMNLYYTFCKTVGHDDRDCRAFDLMQERSRDIYNIKGEVHQDGNNAQYNSPSQTQGSWQSIYLFSHLCQVV
jgi:hypothetical protein